MQKHRIYSKENANKVRAAGKLGRRSRADFNFRILAKVTPNSTYDYLLVLNNIPPAYCAKESFDPNSYSGRKKLYAP